MIEFFYSPTPNGQKIKIFFEETGLPHFIKRVSLKDGEQFSDEFLKISPNGKIPAIRESDKDRQTPEKCVFESCAILIYLSKKDDRFFPYDKLTEILQWLFWQSSHLGPMAGQAGYFLRFAAEKSPLAINRYCSELTRLYGVLNTRLKGRTFIADEYSIADMACYPWIVPHQSHNQQIEEFPHLKRWFETMSQRAAVARAYDGVLDVYAPEQSKLSAKAKTTLFSSAMEQTK